MRLKQILILSIFAICPSLNANAFYDIQPEDPNSHIFTHLQDIRIMQPHTDGNFYPERQISRAEALAIAMRAGGITIPKEPTAEILFNDVDPNMWYAPVIQRAANLKLISQKNKNFRPNEKITKAEFLLFLFQTTLVDIRPYLSKTKNIAADINQDDWFAPYFAYAKKYQISQSRADELYNPHKYVTRKEAALMTYRQLRLFHGNEMTKTFVELQAEIKQFITLITSKKTSKAELHLQKILKLNKRLTRTKNNTDAVAAQAIYKSMTHLSESLRFFQHGYKLSALEKIHLASKQAERATKKSQTLIPFVNELSKLIEETVMNFTMQTNVL